MRVESQTRILGVATALVIGAGDGKSIFEQGISLP
jgi:hypothetical protein